MEVTVLIENTACKNINHAHGLSLFIKTKKHKIIFDFGPDGELLFKNAEALRISLKDAEIAVLSHGHNDHSGGLEKFMAYNGRARLYMHKLAPMGHYSLKNNNLVYIGMDLNIIRDYADRIIYTDKYFEIDSDLILFSDIATSDFLSGSNKSLLEGDPENNFPDRFLHEQNLIVKEDGKAYLFAGCAHRGIVNILRTASKICGGFPDAVFAGFHLTKPSEKTDEPSELIESIGKELIKYPAIYYTGHCTGFGPYSILKKIARDQVRYMSGGTEIVL